MHVIFFKHIIIHILNLGYDLFFPYAIRQSLRLTLFHTDALFLQNIY